MNQSVILFVTFGGIESWLGLISTQIPILPHDFSKPKCGAFKNLRLDFD